jgi:hypothetical protein
MEIQQTHYHIGIYDPAIDDSWPWHFHYESGRYLSAKHRICSISSAKSFPSKSEARTFYAAWKHYASHKFELIPVTQLVTVPDPVYAPDSPRGILNTLKEAKLHRTAYQIAVFWFSGDTLKDYFTQYLLNKYGKALLEFGIDITKQPLQKLEELPARTDEEDKTMSLMIIK